MMGLVTNLLRIYKGEEGDNNAILCLIREGLKGEDKVIMLLTS